MPRYDIENLTKRFGRITALDDVSFSAEQGEFVVILGPTGAGKTTLLRTLAGLERPDAGLITADSYDITPLPPAQRDMAMVFQNFSLYPRWTVAENLAFPLQPKWRGMAKTEINRRVQWAAELLGLTEKLQALPTELSGGQQQRVAIGRAIVREPKLFLFDEPLASLDAKLREAMTIEIHRLQRRLKVTLLYVTHDQTEALSLADRIVVLDQGKILQIGKPDEIYTQPISPRVARILGNPPINLLSPTQAFRMGWTKIPPATTLGLRPEHVQLICSHQGPGLVRNVEHLGAVTVISVLCEETEIRALAGPHDSLTPGDRVTIHFDTNKLLSWTLPAEG